MPSPILWWRSIGSANLGFIKSISVYFTDNRDAIRPGFQVKEQSSIRALTLNLPNQTRTRTPREWRICLRIDEDSIHERVTHTDLLAIQAAGKMEESGLSVVGIEDIVDDLVPWYFKRFEGDTKRKSLLGGGYASRS